MTWADQGHPLAAVLAGIVAAALGWFVPRLIAALPEPEPEPEPEAGSGSDLGSDADEAPAAPTKILYVDLASRPRLASWTASYALVAGAVLGASVGLEWSLLVLVPLVPACVALAVIDWQTRLLPTRIVLPSTGAAILVAAGVALGTDDTDALVRALIAMLVVRSLFWVLWWFRSSGMGFGDVRLSALLGFVLGYLGWAEVVIGTYASFVVFVVPGMAVAIARRDRTFLKTRVPFGPAMIVGALMGIAVGPAIAVGLGY